MKKEIFVFIGENASTGTPNENTGRMSFYGQVYRIDGTLRQAREWSDMKEHRTTRKICVVGGKKKMRQYCLGQTMRNFEETLHYAQTVYPDANETPYNWVVG